MEEQKPQQSIFTEAVKAAVEYYFSHNPRTEEPSLWVSRLCAHVLYTQREVYDPVNSIWQDRKNL